MLDNIMSTAGFFLCMVTGYFVAIIHGVAL